MISLRGFRDITVLKFPLVPSTRPRVLEIAADFPESACNGEQSWFHREVRL